MGGALLGCSGYNCFKTALTYAFSMPAWIDTTKASQTPLIL